jgi:biotin transport system substrate-specific component
MLMATIFRLLAEEGGEKRRIAALILGLAACYALGTYWFMATYAGETPMALSAALTMCVIPFLLPDLGKLALAVFLARRLKKALK